MSESGSRSVEAAIAASLNIPEASITDDLRRHDVHEWDSLGHVALMVGLERAFGRTITPDKVAELVSVRAIKSFLSGGGGVERRKSDRSEAERVHRGLSSVYLDRTRVSHVDGKEGRLLYRGYSIHDLAKGSSFEETSYLLIHGKLPARLELKKFEDELKANRVLPGSMIELIKTLKDGSPVDVLRTVVSALSAVDGGRNGDSADGSLAKGIRLIGAIPTIVATHQCLREGRPAPVPSPDLPHAANFLRMFFGETPDEDAAALLDRDLLLHADHGSNASTLAARVVAGTGADMHACVTAAVGAFSGPLHGGAAEGVMRMIREIGTPDRAAEYVHDRLENREPVSGFGHRVYRTEDPRAAHLRGAAELLSRKKGESVGLAVIEELVKAMQDYRNHGMAPNVDLYTGAVYQLMDFPDDFATALFAMGRVSGWVAQVLEQTRDNILIRPLLKYIGPDRCEYVEIDKREAR